ncbi:helix-turn-helix domain-containing protein [Actinacidiphila sp. bgisy167]|uniref:helix-turn-helix domain-containing protein n=1 Tax=Actinacidiphila sp. bgisy167 TaxID=3413797 RepID=UPI003D762713
MAQAFCTDTAPPAERHEYWTDAVGKAFIPLEVRTRGKIGIHGAIRQACLADVQIGTLQASPQRMARTGPLIDAGGDGPLVVSLHRAGAGVATQDGREIPLMAGRLVLLDARKPYELDFAGPVRQHLATVPRELVDLPDSALRLATGRAFSPERGVSEVLASYVDALATLTHRCTCAPNQCGCAPASKEFLRQGIVDVLTALVALEGSTEDHGAVERALLPHVRAYIRAHLDDPTLSPASIAAAHQISVSYLHQLFRDEPTTVGRWIQRLRLEACRKDLIRPELAGLTVAAVAHRRGFVSHSHFSRAFRAVYGLSPAEWRQDCLPGAGAPQERSDGARGA